MPLSAIRTFLLSSIIALGGCSSLISQQTSKFSDSLSASVLNSNDPETVRQGAPAYLILLDALVAGSPEDPDLLAAGAKLYNAYAAAFVSDDKRSKLMANKAFDYAKRSLCQQQAALCAIDSMDMPAFNAALAASGAGQLPALYLIGSSWISWLGANSDDWNAIAQLPRAKAVLEKVVAEDDRYDNGGAHLYLGGIATLLPPAMGGKPEEGRAHFEKAIDYSDGKNLLAKVIYAQQYARLVFDQELHNKLLNEVLAADADIPGLTLSNVLAQQQAQVLLDDAADYF